MACHVDKPDEIKGEFELLIRESILPGGEIFEDEVQIPGKGKESFLDTLSTRVEEDLEMPKQILLEGNVL